MDSGNLGWGGGQGPLLKMSTNIVINNNVDLISFT